jgi:hypothetical protein
LPNIPTTEMDLLGKSNYEPAEPPSFFRKQD